MFKPTEGHMPEAIKKEATTAEKNYVIQKNDLLRMDIYSHKGEPIVIPEEATKGAAVSKSSDQSSQQQANEQNAYLVDLNGLAKFPTIGEVKLEGLTLRQAEDVLQKEFSKSVFNEEPFVKLSYANKRVIVLGAPGGQVIPLTNQNVTVVEVLALARGLDNFAKAHNVRLMRGTHFYQMDFSTFQGYAEGNMIVEPGDIIYVEPVRRPLTEALRDNYIFVYPLITVITVIIANQLK
ncbi:MAG TPA: polysaccharide biosynthesis/export family protein [Cyclobacteriaceae bacterium]|jgi:polysaccharide export outer membrane protein|nr:polysaccharide biosynthesis/export family protein [Cyclobacteriaceae bacterium]